MSEPSFDSIITLPSGEPARIIAETPLGGSWIVITRAGDRRIITKGEQA